MHRYNSPNKNYRSYSSATGDAPSSNFALVGKKHKLKKGTTGRVVVHFKSTDVCPWSRLGTDEAGDAETSRHGDMAGGLVDAEGFGEDAHNLLGLLTQIIVRYAICELPIQAPF